MFKYKEVNRLGFGGSFHSPYEELEMPDQLKTQQVQSVISYFPELCI